MHEYLSNYDLTVYGECVSCKNRTLHFCVKCTYCYSCHSKIERLENLNSIQTRFVNNYKKKQYKPVFVSYRVK